MKETLKENIRILKNKGLKIYPIREVQTGSNKKTDYSNNLNTFWNIESKDRIEYSEDYLIRLIESKNIIGFAIPTGYYNNIVVIDVDNKGSKNNEISDELIRKLKEQNTLTIGTAGGGYHFIFRYTDILKKGTTGILGHIDIRTNGLPIFHGIREDGLYNIINNSNIKKLNNDIIKILLDNIEEKPTQTKTKTKPKNKDIRRYDITEEEIKELLRGLPNIFLDSYKDWLKITAILKKIDKKTVWDEWSKQGKNYNKKNNDKIWDDITENTAYNNSFVYLIWLYKYYNPYKKIKNIEQIFKDFTELSTEHLDEAININTKYLNIDLLKEFKKLTIIKSSTNTGKTTLAINYMKTQPTKKILSITHLKTIADDHHARFNKDGLNIFTYEDHEGIINDCFINDFGYNGGVIVINSILRLDLDEDLKNYVIYLDEITAIIETLLNSPTIKERKEIINKFIEILNGCYAIIATDATITDITKEILEGAINEKSKLIINHYKNYENKTAYFIDDYNEILELLENDIINNKTPVICSNSKRRTDLIEIEIEKIKQKYNKDVIIKKYTSTNGEKINSVNEEWEGIIKIYSPSIVQGVDYNPKEAENVYSFVVGNTTIDPVQVSQQIARNRNPLNTYVNIEDAKNKSIYKGDINKVKDFYKGVGETYKSIYDKILKHYNNDYDIKKENSVYNSLTDTKTTFQGVEKIENPITHLYYKYKNNQDILRSSFKYHLKQILKNKGYNIIDKLFYELKEDTKSKEEKKQDKKESIEISNRIKNKQFEDWINNNMTDNNKYKITMDKRLEILNINKTHNEETIRDFKEIITDDRLFNMMVNICFCLCKYKTALDIRTVNKNKTDFIENIYRNNENLIMTYKTLLIKYTDINPYLFTYNEEDYLDQPIEITDDEYNNIKALLNIKSNKEKPKNKIDFLRLVYRLAKNIYGGIISLKKNKSKRINKTVKQFQRVIFHYSLFHKFLLFINDYLICHNTCPYILSFIQSEDFKNINVNIDYDLYNNEDNISILSDETTEARSETTNEDIIKNPYENVDIEILRTDILYLT